MRKFILLFSSMLLFAFGSIAHANLSTGVYSGKFGEGKITLFIDSVNNGKVSGKSLYKHNKRPITGTIKTQGSFLKIVLNEPATQVGDGQFDIAANRNDATILIGTWKVFSKTNTKKGIPAKSFSLNKTSCHYNPYNGNYPQTSLRLLTDDELFTDPAELSYMRNEIYARHGYSFKTNMSYLFADTDWYVPCYTNVDSKLSTIEKQNIKRIKEMEAYMDANPEIWGR